MSGKKLPSKFFEYDFVALSKKEKNGEAKIKLLGLSYIQAGKSQVETAKLLNVNDRTVRDWLKRFRESGIVGLYRRPGQGKPRKLPEAEQEAFRQAILELQANRSGGRVRGEDVQKLMKQKLGVDCCLSATYNALHRMDFVWISGRSKHPQNNPKAQEDFKKTSNRT